MNEKWKWITAGRLRRGTVLLGAVGLTVGAALATGGAALAAGVGSGPGQLSLSPTTGPLTTQATWSTSTACPAGNQGSAQVNEYTLNGTFVSGISLVVASPTSPISGAAFQGTVGALLATSGSGLSATNPGTDEWVVGCYSGAGATGTVLNVQSIFVTATASGTYTTSATAPTQVGTTTTLAVSPTSGVTTTSTVTLTATVTDADATTPAGTVTFFNGSTAINTSPIAVTAGTASTTTTFSAAGTFPITATFTPTSATYASSTSAASNVTVTLAGSQQATNSPVTISVNVAATGALSVSVATNTGVSLSVSGLTATGTLPNVSIKDTRNNFPGWSVMGQEGPFTSTATPSTPISGNQLGWIPAAATGSATFDGTHVVLGGTVAPVSPGLGTTAATLALAHAGFGADPSGATTYIANAALTLDIPATTTAGAYTGSLTITYLSAQA